MTARRKKTPRRDTGDVVCARTFYIDSEDEVQHVEVTSKDKEVPVAKRGCSVANRVRLAAIQFVAELGDDPLAIADHLSQSGTITVYYRK